MKVAPLDYVILVLYFIGLIICGYVGYKKTKNEEDYFVAGRRLGFFMYSSCIAAVILGGASTIGSTRLGYIYGISGAWMVIMIGLGVIAVGFLLATRIAKLRLFTVSEMLAIRYGRQAQVISAVIMALYVTLIATIQVIAMGSIVHVLFGWDNFIAMLISGAIVVLYTWGGGMWSVTLTDVLQCVILTVGVLFVLCPMAISRAGGFANLQQSLAPEFFDFTNIGWSSIFSYFLLFVLGLMIAQDLWQRVFTGKDAKTVKLGTVSAGVYILILAFATALIGMSAKILFPELEVADNAFPYVASEVLPAGLLGLVLSAVLAAQMSTADGPLLASATLITRDILPESYSKKHDPARLGKIITLINGIVVLILALWIQDIIVAIDLAYNLLTGCVFVPVIGGLFWKRANFQGAIGSMIAGAIVVIQQMATKGMTSTDAILYSLPVSLVAFIVVSLLTRPTTQEKEKEWEELMQRD